MNAIKAVVNSLVTASMMVVPFTAVGIKAAEAAMEVEAVAVASEQLAFDAAKTAEEAVVQEAVVAEESVAADEAETLAESNLAEVERESAARASLDGTSSEQASVSEEQAALTEQQRLRQVELRQAQNRKTETAARKEELEQEARIAKLHAIIDREAAVRARKKVYKEGWGKYMNPAPWTFTRFVRNGRSFATKVASGKYSWTLYAFTGMPLVVSYHLSALVAHVFFDLMRVSNVGATDRR